MASEPTGGLVGTVRAVAEPLLAPLGIELVDVEVARAGRARLGRLVVDRDGGVDLDAVTAATRAVSPALDALDELPEPHTLEVSSPGVERPLRRPADFDRFVGTTVEVKTYEPVEGTRRHQGTLVASTDVA